MSGIFDRIQAAGEVVITRTLDLGDFDEAYRGATFAVDVSPSRGHLKEWQDLTEWIAEQGKQSRKDKWTDEQKEDLAATFEQRRLEWYVKTWVNLSYDEALQIRDTLVERHGVLVWDWLTMRTSQMIGEFRREKLKNSGGGS